ncbi:MAG: hypothetical protein R3C05_15750 [Pirellulaceae bacterium]
MKQPNIPRVDAQQESAASILSQLRDKLSPQGDIVSPKGRELTQKVFAGRSPPPRRSAHM